MIYLFINCRSSCEELIKYANSIVSIIDVMQTIGSLNITLCICK